jgi:hypothetical protein
VATKPYGPTDNRYPLEVYTDEVVAENGMGLTQGNLDATGGLRVTQASPLVAGEFHYAINPRFFATTLANGGSAAGGVNGMALLQTGANPAGSATVSSRQAARYLGGTGIYASWTAIYDTPKANSTQFVGIGDTVNGFQLGYNGTTFAIRHRNAGVDTFINQADWNIDPLDGTGPSGVTLNPLTGNVFRVQYLWHGFGPILFYVLADGVSYTLVHEIFWANLNIIPSLSNPTIPLRASVVNAGNATNLTLKIASMGIYNEGYDGAGEWPLIASSGSFGNAKTAITAETSVLTIRNKTANVLGGTNTNMVRVKIPRVSLVAAAGATLFRLLINATLGGTPSYADWSSLESVIETDVAGTTTAGTPAGNERFRYFDPAGTGTPQSFDLSQMNIVLNPGDTLTIAASGSSVNPTVSVQWQELF